MQDKLPEPELGSEVFFMACSISKGILFPFECFYLGKDRLAVRKCVECISTSPDTQEINELCVFFEIVDFKDVIPKRHLKHFNSKVVSNILQELEVEEIPYLDSAAEEDDLFDGEMADNVSHSLLVKWDVLFLADRHLVEEDAYVTVCYSSMLQCTMSSA